MVASLASFFFFSNSSCLAHPRACCLRLGSYFSPTFEALSVQHAAYGPKRSNKKHRWRECFSYLFFFSCTPPSYTFLSTTSLGSVRCRFPSPGRFLFSVSRMPALCPRLPPSLPLSACLSVCVCVRVRAATTALSWGESPSPFSRYAPTRQKKRRRRGGHDGASAHRCFCCLYLFCFSLFPLASSSN